MSRHRGVACDVAVIGAGVVGVTTAHALARRGASFANGAQLSYAYTDALATPMLVKKLASLALGLDPLFRLRLALDPDLYAWLAAFLRNMTRSRFEQNTREILRLALLSQREMRAFLDWRPIKFDHDIPGKMHLYFSETALREARAGVAFKQSHGAEQDVLSANAAIAIEPALAQVQGLVGVVHSPRDAVGDCRLFCEALLQLCRQDLGVEAHFEFDVTGLVKAGDGWRLTTDRGQTLTTERLVLCAGDKSRVLARRLGLRLPIQPMKGYSFTAPLGRESPKVSLTDTKRKLVFCRLGERIRVAGLADLGDGSSTADPARAKRVRDLARDSLPNGADYAAIESEWAGVRPVTPTSRPIIQWVDPSLALNTGHGLLGWTLAMGSAARLARTMPI